MHRTNLIIVLCASVFFTTVVTTPLSQGFQNAQLINDNQNERKFEVMNEHQVKSVILLQHLSTLYTRDFFSDLIRATLDMSVKELLLKVDSTFKDLDRVTGEGLSALNNVEKVASPEIIEELTTIRNDAISKVIDMIGSFIKDLGTVLPLLSNHSTHDPTSDIIFALLGKTLEELVIAIANAMECSLQLLNNTIADFRRLSAKATPEVAAALNRISDEYLNQGRVIITPILDQLRQLVGPTPKFALKGITTQTQQTQHKDLLNEIISTIVGINIENAAIEADNSLSQLIPLSENTRERLSKAFKIRAQDNETSEVEAKVMRIYDSAVDDVIRDMKPILNALLQFEENSRRQKTFVYDMAGSLLGIGTDTFQSYIQSASVRVENTIKLASVKMIMSSGKAGLPSLLKVLFILKQSLRSAKIISNPLLETLKSIVEHRKDEDVLTGHYDGILMALPELENDGHPYNRDAIIKAASDILGFEVSEATKTLKTSLENLDELMESSLTELEMIVSGTEVGLRMDILGIMNETLTNIHITLQPMLDVLLPFLPDAIRQNKEVALDIYTTSNGVNVESFLNYCLFVSRKIPEITNLAVIQIKTRAARAGPTVHDKIEALLRTTDYQTKAIIEPFLEIIAPIISPL